MLNGKFRVKIFNFFVIIPQGTASEATLVALLGAKAKKIQQLKEQHPDWKDYEIVGKLVAYGSRKLI